MFKYNKITKLWVTGLAVATLAGQALAAELLLGIQQPFQQQRRGQRGFQRHRRIDEIRLVLVAPGRGAVQPRRGQQAAARQRRWLKRRRCA